MRFFALGDIIGNRDRMNTIYISDGINLDIVNELIYDFISIGGINGMDISKWDESENTLIFHAFIKGLLNYKGLVNEKFILEIKNELYSGLLNLFMEKKINDIQKLFMYNQASVFTDTHDARIEQYNIDSNNNDCCVHAIAIGMILHGESNRDALMQLSITSSMITHNSPTGYLGGFTSALFCALALEKVPIIKWPRILIDYLISDKLKEISRLTLDNLDIIEDYNQYIRMWKTYQITRFNNNQPIRNKSFSNPMHRARYMNDNFYKDTVFGKDKRGILGVSGYLCMIIAYDSLLECDGKFEKLLIYSIFNVVDAPSIGAIACALYAAVYGKGDAPKTLISQIKKRNDLTDILKKFSKKIAKIN